MDFNQHKVKGDAFIKEKQYQDALDCYTAALASDPSSHTVLSNRSLAFFKLGKFQEALDDSVLLLHLDLVEVTCEKLQLSTASVFILRLCMPLQKVTNVVRVIWYAKNAYRSGY